MSEKKNVDVDEVIKDPQQHYQHPNDVLADTACSREQKIEILQSWQTDASLLQTASDENMGGGERDHLAAVNKALEQLGALKSD